MDESKIDTYLYREYVYAPRGRRVFGLVCGKKYKRLGTVAAKIANKILAPLQYSGTMNSKFFEFWFSDQLLPSLKKGTVIVDNASFHSKKRLCSAARAAHCKLIFLSPYSPEWSLAEKFWAYLKRRLRNSLSFFSSFDDALFTAFKLR